MQLRLSVWLLLLLSSVASAQITLDASDFLGYYGAGTSINRWSIDDASILFDVGTSSASGPQSWTLPSIAWTDSSRADNIDPSSTPYASHFPGAQYAQQASTVIGTLTATFTEFFGLSIDSLYHMGMALHYVGTMNGQPIDTTIFDDDRHLLAVLPIALGWSRTERDSSAIGPDAYNITTRTDAINAYGTLHLPGGSFQALRQQSTETNDVYVGGLLVNSNTTYSYTWLTEEGHVVEMEADTNQPGSGMTRMKSAMLALSGPTPPTAVDDKNAGPAGFWLAQNFPNPFNPSTVVRFGLPTESHVSVKIYDQLGREVSMLVNRSLSAGMHEARWDASGMTSGLYFFRIEAVGADGARFVRTNKMVLMK